MLAVIKVFPAFEIVILGNVVQFATDKMIAIYYHKQTEENALHVLPIPESLNCGSGAWK